jgi:hypothetical protein
VALFAASDIQARLSNAAYVRLYAKSGGGTVDSNFVDTIVAEANSIVKMMTAGGLPDLPAAGMIDPGIIGACVDIANEIAASRHPAASENTGYFLAGRRAREFLKNLSHDRDARPVDAGTGPAQPLPEVLSSETVDVWNEARDGCSRSGF